MAIPPCVAACPANICVQGYIGLLASGLIEEAYRLIRSRVPFPRVLGFVCPGPCERACIRGDYDQPIAINPLKRFIAERVGPEARRRFLDELKGTIMENGLRVAVVGAGPAGLTCAHDLRLRGYTVTVFERLPKPGGLLLTGVPEYRLPREVLEMELREIFELGIEFVGGLRVGEDVPLEELLRKYQAVFLAVGAQQGLKLGLPGEEAEGVLGALKLLRRVNLGLGERPKLKVGPRVAVLGGGDAAVDGARCALRLGAKEALILYRRSREEMPAHPEQLAQAEAEGVRLMEQVAPVRFITEEGRLRGIELIRTELGEPDSSGRRRPIPIPGSEFILEVETAILALGQRPELESELESGSGSEGDGLGELGIRRKIKLELELELERDDRGFILVDGNMMTSVEGLFAGGDLVTGPATVISAVAGGKRAAAGIDRYLRGEEAEETYFCSLAELEAEERYHPPEVPRQPRVEIPQAPPAERVQDFRQVELTLGEMEARAEARRCLACGLCANCNSCIEAFACPALALDEEGRIVIEEALCNGCGVCPQLCPNDALVEEREGSDGR